MNNARLPPSRWPALPQVAASGETRKKENERGRKQEHRFGSENRRQKGWCQTTVSGQTLLPPPFAQFCAAFFHLNLNFGCKTHQEASSEAGPGPALQSGAPVGSLVPNHWRFWQPGPKPPAVLGSVSPPGPISGTRQEGCLAPTLLRPPQHRAPRCSLQPLVALGLMAKPSPGFPWHQPFSTWVCSALGPANEATMGAAQEGGSLGGLSLAAPSPLPLSCGRILHRSLGPAAHIGRALLFLASPPSLPPAPSGRAEARKQQAGVLFRREPAEGWSGVAWKWKWTLLE